MTVEGEKEKERRRHTKSRTAKQRRLKILAILSPVIIVMVFLLFIAYISVTNQTRFEGLIKRTTPRLEMEIRVVDVAFGEIYAPVNSSWYNQVSWWKEDGERGAYIQRVAEPSMANPRIIPVPRDEMYCAIGLPRNYYMFFDETVQMNTRVLSVNYTDFDGNGVFDYTVKLDVKDAVSKIVFGVVVGREAAP